MKRLFLILLITIYTLTFTYSQVQQDWVARYNGTANSSDVAYSIAIDAVGNVYVTGSSYDNSSYNDYTTIKYNSSGVQQWISKYNGPSNSGDIAYSIAVDGTGNVFITGQSWGSTTRGDYATVKYNSSGVQQWAQRYNAPENYNDAAYAIAIDGSGNVYVTGYVAYSPKPTSYSDYATIKYNSFGVQQWVQRYNGPGNFYDEAHSLAMDFQGNVYVTGYSIGSGTSFDCATIKYNSSGVPQWISRYNGPANNSDGAYSIAVEGSGNVYVTGWSVSSGNAPDYITIKYNSSGVQQWAQRYDGGNNYDVAYSIAVDGSGNAFITGESFISATNYDYATVKYSSSGVQEWVQRYNGPGNNADYGNSIAVDSSGNVYVTGGSRTGSTSTTADYATIKYNSSGVQKWIQRYNGPGNSEDIGYSIALDGSGNVCVAGYSTGSGTGYDYATIKYSQPVGIQPISTEIPENFSLFQNHPNPFNPMTHLSFDLPAGKVGFSELRFVSLRIFDILGREITTLVNEQLNPGTYEVEWDGTNYTSGIYYYKMNAGDYSETKKMVLIK